MRCNKLCHTGTMEYTSSNTSSYQLTSHTSYHDIILTQPQINSIRHIFNQSIPQLHWCLLRLWYYINYTNMKDIMAIPKLYSASNQVIQTQIRISKSFYLLKYYYTTSYVGLILLTIYGASELLVVTFNYIK